MLKLINTILSFSLLYSALVNAEEENLTWGGFISQGLVYTDNYNFIEGSKNGLSTDFREAAIYGLWRPTNHLRLGGQVIARELGNMTDDTPQIDYLSADYSLLSTPASSFGIRLGKLKLANGFYNNTREVPFTRNSILLPQSMYYEETRDFQLSALGVEFYGSEQLETDRLEYSLLASKPRKDQVSEFVFFRRNLSGYMDDGYLLIANLRLVEPRDAWRLGVTLGSFGLTYFPGSSQELGLEKGDIDVKFFAISAEYNWERFSVTSEFFKHYIDYADLGGFFAVEPKQTFEAFYVQGVYRPTHNVDLLMRYDLAYRDAHDRSGKKHEKKFGVPASNYWSKDLTLGVGWQATSSILLRAEWHHIRGTARVPEQENSSNLRKHSSWNMLLVQAAYRF